MRKKTLCIVLKFFMELYSLNMKEQNINKFIMR